MNKDMDPSWKLRKHICSLGFSQQSYNLLNSYGFSVVHQIVSASSMLPNICRDDKETEQEITEKTLRFLGGISWEKIKKRKEYREDAEIRHGFVKIGLADCFAGLTSVWLHNRTGHKFKSNLACIRKAYPQFINLDAIRKTADEENWPDEVWEDICLLYFGEVKDR